MDADELARLLEGQKRIAKEASSRQGQKATNKSTRYELLREHSMRNLTGLFMGQAKERQIRTCITNASYPPSKVPLSQLKHILLADLRLETHHKGCVIFLRAIAAAVRILGVMNIVEDTSGAVDRLSVYNASLDSGPQDVIRLDRVYAVKEPYYKASADGGYSIRVDHPSDLMLVSKDHNLMPQAFAPRLREIFPAETYKMVGNLEYKEKQYRHAIETYSYGIQACTDEEQDLNADLHRNRAQMNLLLGRYEHALRDANRSVELLSPGAKTDALNCKALYRAGRALYALSRFKEARTMFEQALRCSPADGESEKALTEVNMRIAEATTGVYDMDSFIALNRTRPKRLNAASYIKNVAVRPAGERGRGLFAKKAFKVGDTIIFEKAFDISFAMDPSEDMPFLMDVNTGRGLTGTHAALFYSLAEKLRYNSLLARKYLDLYSGGYTPRYNACEVDESTVLDSFEILAIMQSNVFGTARNEEEEHISGVGIWLTASYANHACNANASRSFLGDMMLFKATRDIAKGEEIFISYVGLETGREEAQAKLQSQWSIKCACPICTTEEKTTAVQQRRRRTILRELTALIKVNTPANQHIINQRAIRQVEAMYAKLADTYSPALFDGMPRQDLLLPSFRIAASYPIKDNMKRAKPAWFEVLRNCGVFVTIQKDGITIARQHGIVSQILPVVDAFVHLMAIYEYEGQTRISAQFNSLAHSMWLLMRPSMEGFAERFLEG